MTTLNDPATDVPSGPSTRAKVLGVCLAGASGLAVVLDAFTPWEMSATVPLIVIPATLLIGGLFFASLRRYPELDRFAARTISGIACGLLATVAYDIVRPIIVWIFQFHTNPYKAMPLFGSRITGRPTDDGFAVLVGWLYHFWNGISFGVMFALVRPRGGAIAGLIWGVGLQVFMILVYPSFLDARLDDVGFMVTGLLGHAIWGLVLGASLKRWGRG